MTTRAKKRPGRSVSECISFDSLKKKYFTVDNTEPLAALESHEYTWRYLQMRLHFWNSNNSKKNMKVVRSQLLT